MLCARRLWLFAAVVVVWLGAGAARAQSFEDAFTVDSIASYTLTLIQPAEGTGTFVYDSVGRRAQIRTGNDFGLRVAHALPARSTGRLSLDLLPTTKWPNGGQTWIRLRQDAANYYEIYNSDGYGPGTLRKVVNGATVASASFASGYIQNAPVHVSFDFAPDHAELSAWAQSLEIDSNFAPLSITSLEIEAYQQTTWLDNISYGDIVNLAPTARAGADQAVPDGTTVQLDGSTSSDLDGSIASYSWTQIAGPLVALTGASTATPSFVAPDPGSGSIPLIFRLTVTDDQGAPGIDEVRIDAWNSESLRFSDSFAADTLGSYALTLIEPTEGTATFYYDAVGQRAQIRTGNDFGLRVAHAVPPRSDGRFSLDLLPTQKWPSAGRIFLRLLQDSANYYEISNFDGSAPGGVRKVVNGVVVASAAFSVGYVQNAAYHVALDFAPGLTELRAFGQTLVLNQNATPLTIQSIEIETYQQTMWVDDIAYEEDTNAPPTANAGPDSAIGGGQVATLDGRASADLDGTIASYAWQQLSGPSVTLVGANSAQPSFVAPDLASGTQTLEFRLSVTDDGGLPASDTVQIVVWASSELSFTDGFVTDTTGGYTVTLVLPEFGTGQLSYDAVNQRAQIRTGNDFGVRIARPLPPRSSGRFGITLNPTKKYPSGGKIWVRLIQDAANYYEIYNTDGYGSGSLAKVVNGNVVEIASFSSGYAQNRIYPLTFDFSAGLSTLEGFGQFLALEHDASPLLVTRLEIEAYQQDFYFDDLSLADFVERQSFVRLTAPADGGFQTSSTLNATAISFRFQPGWRVAFALDPATPDEQLVVDPGPPYAAAFTDVEKGAHSVVAYVVDAGGNQVLGAELSDEVSIEVGDYFVGVGDSITAGTGDNLASDDVSADGRDSGGGYEPPLNDALSAETGWVNTVKNEGVGGPHQHGRDLEDEQHPERAPERRLLPDPVRHQRLEERGGAAERARPPPRRSGLRVLLQGQHAGADHRGGGARQDPRAGQGADRLRQLRPLLAVSESGDGAAERADPRVQPGGGGADGGERAAAARPGPLHLVRGAPGADGRPAAPQRRRLPIHVAALARRAAGGVAGVACPGPEERRSEKSIEGKEGELCPSRVFLAHGCLVLPSLQALLTLCALHVTPPRAPLGPGNGNPGVPPPDPRSEIASEWDRPRARLNSAAIKRRAAPGPPRRSIARVLPSVASGTRALKTHALKLLPSVASGRTPSVACAFTRQRTPNSARIKRLIASGVASMRHTARHADEARTTARTRSARGATLGRAPCRVRA